MSVVEQLGVADLAQGLEEARQLWQDWVEQDPRLASAPAVDGLRDWLMLVGIDAADEVLHALVQIGSPSGRDCRPAAWVVAWALLPGAIAVARRAPAGPETDALVASQLWLEIRQFPWCRHQKVAGNAPLLSSLPLPTSTTNISLTTDRLLATSLSSRSLPLSFTTSSSTSFHDNIHSLHAHHFPYRPRDIDPASLPFLPPRVL